MAGEKTGASTIIAAKIGGTLGSAIHVGVANAQVEGFNFNTALNSTVRRPSPIGSGKDMDNETDVGAGSPIVTLGGGEDRYDGTPVELEALWWGADSVAGSSVFTHSLLYEATRNQKYATIVRQATTGSVYEYAACTPTNVTIAATANDYAKKTIALLADAETTDGTGTNGAVGPAYLENATNAGTKRVVFSLDDYFLLSEQDGDALATGDAVAITDYSCSLDHAAVHMPEVDGTAGMGAPVSSGDAPLAITLTVTFKQQVDFQWVDAQRAGYEFKAEIRHTSPDSADFRCRRYFPRLIIADQVDAQVASAGINPQTVTFKALLASAAVSGMPVSSYPSTVYVNDTPGSYHA